MTEYNEVTKPAHYDWATVGGISALDAFADTTYVFGCGMKYILRYPKKNQFQDVQKAFFLFDYMASKDALIRHAASSNSLFRQWVCQLVEDARDQLTAMQRQIFGMLAYELDYLADEGWVSPRVIRAIRDLLHHYLGQPLDVMPAFEAGRTDHRCLFKLTLPTLTDDLTPRLLVRDRLLDADLIDPVVEQWVVSHPIYRTDRPSWPVPTDADDYPVFARPEDLEGQL